MSSKLRQEIFYYFEKKIFNSFSECNVVDYLKKLTTFEDGVQVKYTIVIDAESCLDRLYGGYFSGNFFLSIYLLIDLVLSFFRLITYRIMPQENFLGQNVSTEIDFLR